MIAIDILYSVTFVVVSYITFLHLILWTENKEKLLKKIKISKLPSISVLVPAFNEEDSIKDTIKNLLGINYPKKNLEIIVIDDGSTDRTYEIAKRYEGKIKILKKKNGGKASALNFGIDNAKSEFVAVVDADTLLEKNALMNCMKYFEDESIAAVTSHILTKQKNKLIERLQNVELMIIALTRKLKEGLNLIDVTPGPLSVYRKDILMKVGKFDENNLTEDVEIAWRILRNNYKIKMAYDAMAYSNCPSSLGKWWMQRTRWDIGGIQTLLKHLDCLFKKGTSSVKTFILPFSITSYLLNTLGIVAFLYLLVSSFLYLIKSFFIGADIFQFNISYSINVFSIYGAITLLLSLLIMKISLDSHKKKSDIVTLAMFLPYMLLLPFVYLYSIYKFARHERRWLTK